MSKSGNKYMTEMEECHELIHELKDSLKDVLSRFRSAIGAGGEIEGDQQAINKALSLIEKVEHP